jgi:hypothetical protein
VQLVNNWFPPSCLGVNAENITCWKFQFVGVTKCTLFCAVPLHCQPKIRLHLEIAPVPTVKLGSRPQRVQHLVRHHARVTLLGSCPPPRCERRLRRCFGCLPGCPDCSPEGMLRADWSCGCRQTYVLRRARVTRLQRTHAIRHRSGVWFRTIYAQPRRSCISTSLG